jgi:hypothetical protein
MTRQARFSVPLVAAAVAFLALLVPGAAGASPSVYTDPAGDSKSAPDLIQVTLTDNGNGTVGVDLKLAGPTNLGSDGLLGFFIDSDRNRSTGDTTGSEFLLLANQAAAVFEKWNGSTFASFAHQPVSPAFNGTDLTFTLTLSDLGGITSFDFAATSLRGNDIDVAPDSGGTFPQAAPQIRSILVPLSALTPRAGRVYRIDTTQIRVRLSDDSVIGPDSVTCKLMNGRKTLRPLGGGCAWKLSKKLKGKKLALTLVVSYQGQTETFTFPVRAR